MSHLIPNSFSTYQLTDEEALQGQILTTLQIQVLQNHRADIAEEKLALSFDANNHLQFAQAEASLKGQLEIIAWLLDSSEVATEQLNSLPSTEE